MTPGLHVVNDVPEDQMYLWQSSNPRREPTPVREMTDDHLLNAERLCRERSRDWVANTLAEEIRRRGLQPLEPRTSTIPSIRFGV